MAEETPTNETINSTDEKNQSGSMLLGIIIFFLLLLIIIGGTIALMIIKDNDSSTDNKITKEALTHPKINMEKVKPEGNEHIPEVTTEVGIIYPLDHFVANILSEGGKNYLKVEMNFEMEGKELSPELEEKKPLFRDIIIGILSSKSIEDISTSKGKEKIKTEIIDKINPRLKDNKIIKIYFTDFVVK
jgi:flagellar protein FliL